MTLLACNKRLTKTGSGFSDTELAEMPVIVLELARRRDGPLSLQILTVHVHVYEAAIDTHYFLSTSETSCNF
jgi:hypothetical protein